MDDNTKVIKNDEEKFQVPTKKDVKRRELISVLAELILNYSLTRKG
jgi:hypothetical protein